MAFHIEISSGFHRARAFNLDRARLQAEILGPWTRGGVITLGDREWEPKDCSLVVLEGPDLADADLAMGRGWSNAERASENVTRRIVGDAAVPVVAVLADGDAADAIKRALKRLELRSEPWSRLRDRILTGADDAAGPSAAVLALGDADPTPRWLFDAGLALGALGRRAVPVQLGGGPTPDQLASLEFIRVDPADESSLRALWQRLTL